MSGGARTGDGGSGGRGIVACGRQVLLAWRTLVAADPAPAVSMEQAADLAARYSMADERIEETAVQVELALERALIAWEEEGEAAARQIVAAAKAAADVGAAAANAPGLRLLQDKTTFDATMRIQNGRYTHRLFRAMNHAPALPEVAEGQTLRARVSAVSESAVAIGRPHPADVVLSVAIFMAPEYCPRGRHFVKGITHAPVQCVDILGSQTFADLRAALYCREDKVLDGHLPENMARFFFFVDGVFFCNGLHAATGDQPAPGADEAAPALEWLSQSALRRAAYGVRGPDGADGAASAAERRGADTPLSDVAFRLGRRYLFQHQGGCQHSFAVYDARIYEPFRDPPIMDFPRTTFMSAMRRRLCRVCDQIPAALVVFGDRLADESPMYLCQRCHHHLHYDHQGKLLYSDFEVFPYAHD